MDIPSSCALSPQLKPKDHTTRQIKKYSKVKEQAHIVGASPVPALKQPLVQISNQNMEAASIPLKGFSCS